MITTSINTQVNTKELETRVKKMYREVALHPEVTYHFEMGRNLAERLGYSATMLNDIPNESIDSFAGVGYYFDLASLRNGETVVDLGSGSGMDVFYAANQVGETGEVIGIDMTTEQLEKSESLKGDDNFNQVTFRESHIEELPIDSDSVDAVVSNGVINLSSDKERAFQEAARVLKQGGCLAISDIVSTEKLPDSVSCNVGLWAACIGGAMQIDEYLSLIEAAGMEVAVVEDNPYSFISNGAKGVTKDYGIRSISILAIKL